MDDDGWAECWCILFSIIFSNGYGGIGYPIFITFDEIASCLCAGEEERRTFSPAHMQAIEDQDFNVINILDRVQQEETITKIPVTLVTNGHAPESIFDV